MRNYVPGSQKERRVIPMRRINFIHLVSCVVFLLLIFVNASAVELIEKPDNERSTESDKKILTPSEVKRAWRLLKEFQSITEKVRQLEKEKMDLLDRLEGLKKELSGTKYLSDRFCKTQIEKIIRTLHTKIEETNELIGKQRTLLEKIAQDQEIKQLIRQRIGTLSEELERLKSAPDKRNKKKIEQAQRELKKWQDLENVIKTVEDYGVEEVLAFINTPKKLTSATTEEEIFPGQERPAKLRHPFLLGRLQWRLKRMEDEIRFLRQQIEHLDKELKIIRRSLSEESIPPIEEGSPNHHPPERPEKNPLPPPGNEIHHIEGP